MNNRFFQYKDFSVRILVNMVRNAQLFGSYQNLSKNLFMDVFSCFTENSFHHMDTIIQTGEISHKLYFVTCGQVGVFVNLNADFSKFSLDEEQNSPL